MGFWQLEGKQFLFSFKPLSGLRIIEVLSTSGREMISESIPGAPSSDWKDTWHSCVSFPVDIMEYPQLRLASAAQPHKTPLLTVTCGQEGLTVEVKVK